MSHVSTVSITGDRFLVEVINFIKILVHIHIWPNATLSETFFPGRAKYLYGEVCSISQ